MKVGLSLSVPLLTAAVLALGPAAPARAAGADKVTVVNMMPKDQSDEENEDSEPSLAVNPENPLQMAGTAFTPNPNAGDRGPIYVSVDGGKTWKLNPIVPSQAGSSTGTGDITIRFASTGGKLYSGILRLPGTSDTPRVNILRTPMFTTGDLMEVEVDKTDNGFDQPFVEAITIGGKDRVFVGVNDFNAPNSRTATIFLSPDAATAPPPAGFKPVRIESRSTGTARQDAPSIRTALHEDGTAYVAFLGWRTKVSDSLFTGDVVVVRDDNGAGTFTALKEPPAPAGDGLSGVRIVRDRKFPWDDDLGNDRTGSDVAIAVDPQASATVYVAWADRVGAGDYTLHVRKSTNKGVAWSANDLRTVTNAKNPALAVDSNGRVGFLYQKLTGGGQNWETHLELSNDGFASPPTDLTLASTPVSGWQGDYLYLMTVGRDFYGVFCAENTPDDTRFPASKGATYQRNADKTAKKLLGSDNMTEVQPSMDPFFFKVHPDGN